MTDLQISLILIGCLIVGAVFSYNKWQEHKARKSVDRAFSGTHEDVLMTPEGASARTEPSFTPQAHDDEQAAPDSPPAMDAEFDSPAEETAAEHADMRPQSAAAVKPLPVDELVDCIIPVVLDAPVRGERLLQALQPLRHAGAKPVYWIGQATQGQWEEIAPGGAYVAIRVGVQLANRSGALTEIEYSELLMQLRHVTDSVGGDIDVPDMPKVMSSARSLHQFVSAYDAQLSVNVRSNGEPWPISTLLAALERHGFDLRPDNRLIMPDGEGGILFSLSTNVTLAAETTSLLTLLLNVPCVAPDRDGFGAMIGCARMLAARLDGVIVDDGGQPLNDAALAEITNQVAVFYEDMNSADIPAGSVRAMRLFG